MKPDHLVLAGLALALASTGLHALPRDCAIKKVRCVHGPRSLGTEAARAPLVFEAEVLEVRPATAEAPGTHTRDGTEARLRVIRSYQGELPEEVHLTSQSCCGIGRVGESWIYLARPLPDSASGWTGASTQAAWVQQIGHSRARPEDREHIPEP